MKKQIYLCIGIIALTALDSVSFSEGFIKSPYLQNFKTGEITICWKIEGPGDTSNIEFYKLEYGIGGYSNIMPYPEPYPTDSKFFQLTLIGLQPGTIYQYRVKSGSQWSDEATFFTAVESNQSFSFAVYGDSQPKKGKPTNNHEDVVNLIISYSPDFVVHCGDMWFTNESPDVQLFFDISNDLMKNIPLFPTLGNHEYLTKDPCDPCTPYTEPTRYRKYCVVPTNLSADEDYYSFDYGNSHFIVTNASLVECGPDYHVGSAQYTAIESDLISAAGNPDIAHIFAFVHKPAHGNGWKHGCGHGSVIEDPNISVYLGELFQTYDVDIVFSGHDHNYERFQPVGNNHQQIWICDPPGDPCNSGHLCNIIDQGVTYVVTGGGGASLGNVDPAGTTEDCPAPDPGCDLPTPPLTSIIAEKTFHATFVTVDGEEVYVEVRDIDDSIIDQFTIIKEVPAITLIEPNEGAVLSLLTPATFTWEADPNYRFKIEFSPTSAFPHARHTLSFPRWGWMPITSTDDIPAQRWQRVWQIVQRMHQRNGIVYWRVIGKTKPSAPIDISETRGFTLIE